MKNLELIKIYPGWPWLLAPLRSSPSEVIRPDAPPGRAQPPVQSATGRPRGGEGNAAAAIDWELAVRAKP